MANYTQTTNFTAKDGLTTGDPAKKIVGAEFDTEFGNIASSLITKADVNSPALTGIPTAPTAAAGTNTTQVATTAFVKTAVDNYVIPDAAVSTAKIAPTGVTEGIYGSATEIPIITVNAEGQVTEASTASITIPDPIGVGQTWQNVTASRTLGATYTNDTGRPIQVTASVQNTASASVGGVTIFNSYTVSCCGVPQISFFPLSFIVPADATYSISGTALATWAELR